MFVRDVMSRPVVTVSPQTSVLNARRLLLRHRIRHLPVVLGSEVVGMVSDRDVRADDPQLAHALSALQSDLVTGRYRRVDTVMSAPVISAAPADTVEEAAERMVARRIGALPVVEGGQLVGIIGLTDCVSAMLRDRQRPPQPQTAPADVDAVIRLDAGDSRPGRPARRQHAVVVHPDALQRLRTRNELAAAGYTVTTCPGPSAGVFCPAASGSPIRCARVSSDTTLVVVDDESARSELPGSYQRWLDGPTIRITSRPSVST